MTWTANWWEPVNEMKRLQAEVNRLFSGYGEVQELFPAVNVWSDTSRTVVKAEVPGVDPKNLDISVQGDLLTLRGERSALVPKGGVCHRQERSVGRFQRTLRLPYEIDAGQVTARTDQGILTVTLPRAESSKPKRIAIQAG